MELDRPHGLWTSGATAAHPAGYLCGSRVFSFRRLASWVSGTGRTDEAVRAAAALTTARQNYCAGVEHFRAGHHARAEEYFNEAIRTNNDLAEAHFYLALLERKKGDLASAAERLHLVTRLNPDLAAAWLYTAVIALDRKHYEQATIAFNRALELRPDYPEALNGLGKLHEERMEFKAAADLFRRAIASNARYALAYSNLAHVTLREFFDAEAALGYVKKGLELDATLAGAHNNLAMILQFQGRCEESLAACKRALELNPDSPDTLLIRALAQLMLGRYEAGWRDYEARKHRLSAFTIRRFPYPEWDGSPLNGCQVLVYHEQGIGDEIMFASCLPDLFRLGGRYVVECSKKLEQLFKRSFPQATIQVSNQKNPDMRYLDALPPIDYQVAAGSLPGFFRRRMEDFPCHTGYLVANKDRAQYWRDRTHELGAGLKVGLSWRGGRYYTNEAGRSIALEQLQLLFTIPNVRFISVQYGDCLDDRNRLCAQTGLSLTHWQDAIDDYDETAALVSALDLIVSVQTAVAHLAGALGKSVFVMVPSTPEWRYMAQGSRMPWYPTARLFRQSTPKSWASVIEEVGAALRAKGEDTSNA